MPTNLGYAASPTGILKLVAFALGLAIAVVMFIYMSPSENDPKTDGALYFRKNSKLLYCLLDEDKCPPHWLITVSAIIAIACCVFSILSLLLIMLMELNKKGVFSQIDMFGHLGAGGSLVVAGIMTITYAAMAFSYMKCGDKKTEFGTDLCNKARETIFRTTPFVCCGIGLLLDGAVSVIAGLLSKKK